MDASLLESAFPCVSIVSGSGCPSVAPPATAPKEIANRQNRPDSPNHPRRRRPRLNGTAAHRPRRGCAHTDTSLGVHARCEGDREPGRSCLAPARIAWLWYALVALQRQGSDKCTHGAAL